MRKRTGRGYVNTLINKLPVELHIPSYSFCGPGTKLARRLKAGDKGVNRLDGACRAHDIVYSKHKSLEARHKADFELENRAWERVKSKDASLGEKASAWLVTSAMKIKRKLGMGMKMKKKKIFSKQREKQGSGLSETMKKVFRGRRRSRRGKNVQTFGFKTTVVLPTSRDIKQGHGLGNHRRRHRLDVTANIAKIALTAARKHIRARGGKKHIRIPRVIPVPKTGGILPLLPLFAGLSALGALGGGTAGIVKAINAAKAAKNELGENVRHNKTMEAIALGKAKSGSGLYLGPFRKGMGLFLSPQPSCNGIKER